MNDECDDDMIQFIAWKKQRVEMVDSQIKVKNVLTLLP